jgi:hypothetical protein
MKAQNLQTQEFGFILIYASVVICEIFVLAFLSVIIILANN